MLVKGGPAYQDDGENLIKVFKSSIETNLSGGSYTLEACLQNEKGSRTIKSCTGPCWSHQIQPPIQNTLVGKTYNVYDTCSFQFFISHTISGAFSQIGGHHGDQERYFEVKKIYKRHKCDKRAPIWTKEVIIEHMYSSRKGLKIKAQIQWFCDGFMPEPRQ